MKNSCMLYTIRKEMREVEDGDGDDKKKMEEQGSRVVIKYEHSWSITLEGVIDTSSLRLKTSQCE